MKPIVLLAVLLTGILTSCKKDYYCECRQAGVLTASKTYHDTKFGAKNKCKNLDTNYYETTCGLK